jgi:Acyl-CoA dehydrogenase, C-terminal domain
MLPSLGRAYRRIALSHTPLYLSFWRAETDSQPSRDGAKDTFTTERTGVAPMALGIVERCLELCMDYAKTRVQFGKTIGEFQLIQLKLAKLAVARANIQNLVFRQIELAGWGRSMDLAEASACKLYSAVFVELTRGCACDEDSLCN